MTVMKSIILTMTALLLLTATGVKAGNNNRPLMYEARKYTTR
jgi:hypothetical protein